MRLIKSILSSFKYEIHEIIGDKLYIYIVLALPISMILFFSIMFYRGDVVGIPVVVVDRDNSAMSRKIISMIDATPGVDIAFRRENIDSAEQLFLSGDVVGIIYLDDDFEANIYREVPVDVECYLSGTTISASGIVERDVQQAIKTFSAGVAIQKLEYIGVGYSQVMVDIMPINVQTNIISNPYLNYGYYLAPIFMFMGVVIFTMLATIYAFGRELRYARCAIWRASGNGSFAAAIIGKLLPITLFMAVVSQLIYAILFILMGMECTGSYLLLTLASLLLIFAYQAVAMFIISLTSNLRLALSLGGGYAVMAFTFSGVTFPTMAMFKPLQLLAKLFPLTYFSEVLVDQSMRGTPFIYDILPMAVLLCFVVLMPLCWRRLKNITINKKYWGRE